MHERLHISKECKRGCKRRGGSAKFHIVLKYCEGFSYASIRGFQVNTRNTNTMYEMFLTLMMKISKRLYWYEQYR